MLAKCQPSAAQGGRHSAFPTSIGLPGGSASTDFYQRGLDRGRRTRRAMATLTWALALVDLSVCHITKTFRILPCVNVKTIASTERKSVSSKSDDECKAIARSMSDNKRKAIASMSVYSCSIDRPRGERDGTAKWTCCLLAAWVRWQY